MSFLKVTAKETFSKKKQTYVLATGFKAASSSSSTNPPPPIPSSSSISGMSSISGISSIASTFVELRSVAAKVSDKGEMESRSGISPIVGIEGVAEGSVREKERLVCVASIYKEESKVPFEV